MRTVHEGEVLQIEEDLGYDYLEMKYITTDYLTRKPFIIVPVSYPDMRANARCHFGACDSTVSGMSRIKSEECMSCHYRIDELSIRSSEELPELSSESGENNTHSYTGADGSDGENTVGYSGVEYGGDIYRCRAKPSVFHEYKDMGERVLLLNYFKCKTLSTREGILGYEEFFDFRVTQDVIVRSQSYIVKKPFHIEERLHGSYKSLNIRKFIKSDVKLSADSGVVIQSGETYKIYGKCSCYTLTANSVLYRFPSNVFRE
jgi:hypothetical protein